MTRTTVFLILDAARADYVRPETMPFLHGLSADAITGSFESPPGFAQRTALFTGRGPQESGNFSAFAYDPDESPFRWVRRLGPLRALVRPRRVMVPARYAIARITKALTGAYHTDPAWIPLKYLPFFRPCEDLRPVHDPGALGAVSIFDQCRAHGLRFRYLAHPVSGNDAEVQATLVRELRRGAPTDLYVAQLSATDELGHRHGPLSEAMRRDVLPRMDDALMTIHAALSAGHDAWDLVVCGDHGMAPVTQRVDVTATLRAADARPVRDYVAFVNSTLLVLWYRTERGARAVENVLARIPGADVLSDADRARLGMPTDARWGDRMVAARPGVLFWPDYFHVTDSVIRGMHGYVDKATETHGLMVLASSAQGASRLDVGRRPLVDVCPTLCDLLDLPTPRGQEGESLLRARPAPPTIRTPA